MTAQTLTDLRTSETHSIKLKHFGLSQANVCFCLLVHFPLTKYADPQAVNFILNSVVKDQKCIFFFSPVEHSSMEHNVRQGDRTEEECKNKVKLQSRADPGNTSAVTSDDNHQVLSEQRVERKSNGGKWRLDSDETLISDDGR